MPGPRGLCRIRQFRRCRGADPPRPAAVREVGAGSCDGCEPERRPPNNTIFGLERFGFRFAASPEHADVPLVTGPVTRNMAVAPKRTFDDTPKSQWMVGAGDCACGTGLFAPPRALEDEDDPADHTVPIGLHIRDCRPTLHDLLRGRLALLEAPDGRVGPRRRPSLLAPHRPR